MSQFDKAVDFYLRGFNGTYIKRRTNISIQSLLKQLLAQGIRYTKDDIVVYQVQYIQKHYSCEDVRLAYMNIIRKYTDLEKARRGHHITCLGCGFGDYPRVFRKILGDDVYKSLSGAMWHEKQAKTVHDKYGVDNVFDKSVFDKVVSEDAILKGRVKRVRTLQERYGVSSPNADPNIAAKMQQTLRQTNMARYGVENAMQRADIAAKSCANRQKTMLERYGAANSVEVSEIRNRIFGIRNANGTSSTSKSEDMLYDMLVNRFGADDVLRNFNGDSRYPFHVDFYIKSLDLFIELNGDRCHNDHWFDASSVSDRQTAEAWLKNAEKLEVETGKSSRYRKYLHVWTESDVLKRNTARKNKLHYLVFWDGGNKSGVPTLIDANAWFSDGCPMPEMWHAENTY